jgi:cytochrome c oxidase subunit I
MRRIRLPFGPTSLWLLGALYAAGAQWLVSANQPASPASNSAMTYFVLAQTHYSVSLTVAFLAFAAIYFVLERVARLRIRRWLGQAHFWAMFIGVNLIMLPALLARFEGLRSPDGDLATTFERYDAISLAGYVATLAGVVVFAVLLIDALLRRFRPSQAPLGAR